MKLETFFEKFDQFADAPNAVAKMRELLLQLAVQGKLVDQNGSDENADQLLAAISSERDTRAAKLRTPSEPASADGNDHAFPIPSNWAWTQLGKIALQIQYGYTASADPSATEIRMLRITDIQNNRVDWPLVPGCQIESDEAEKYLLSPNDILIARTGGTIGKSFIVPDAPVKSVFASYLIRVTPPRAMVARYLKTFLESPLYWAQLREMSAGTGQPNVNGQALGRLAIPLPPLAEQKRIVAKVDELMALCDRLEAQQQEREEQASKLARASLARFADAPTPANLQFLFHTSYAIEPADLRKSILTLAVQGKLVPQDFNEEPAEQPPGKANRKKAKWEGTIDEQETPFQLPASWKWFRLGDVASLKHGYAFSSNFFTSEPAPFVLTTPGNFYEKGGFRDRESKRKYYSGPVDPEFVFQPGDLIIPMTEQAAGLLGSPAFIPDDGRVYIHNQRLGKLSFVDSIAAEFAFWFFNCDFFRGELARTCTGMKVRHTSPDRVLKVPFPLPPLAEQRRIVAKVQQLMALVDALETQLATSRATAANLLSALVAELTTQKGNGDET